LHRNAFGARIHWGSYSTPPGRLAVIRVRGDEGLGIGGRKGRTRTGVEEWEGEWGIGRGREGVEGADRVGKGEGGLDLDICPGSPKLPVTPLIVAPPQPDRETDGEQVRRPAC